MKMVKQDLRTWIAAIDTAGQLQRVSGAEPKEEIGGIVDIFQRRIGNKAVPFDDVPGFPRGYRVLANILTSIPRISMMIGLSVDSTAIDLVGFWRPTYSS
jgi:3-polyprenyl-4-hydroxybenzoate decarboxylase